MWEQAVGEDGSTALNERKLGHKPFFGCFPLDFPHRVKDSLVLPLSMLCLVAKHIGPFLRGFNWHLCSLSGSWLLSRMMRH